MTFNASNSTSSTEISPQLRVALAWVEGFNNWNINEVAAQLSESEHGSYEHHILPASLGRPVRQSKQEWLDHFSSYIPMFKYFHVTVVSSYSKFGVLMKKVASPTDGDPRDSRGTTKNRDPREYNLTIEPKLNLTPELLQAKSSAESTTDAPYRNEYILILSFDDSVENPKICSVKEFVDSAFSEFFFPEERQRQAVKAQKGNL